ncbi:MAG: hypothetical protein ACQESF_03215 [Nanobdellota archaeon]
MNKSQVTVFIVLGMLILAVALLLFYVNSLAHEPVDVEVKDKYVLKSTLQPVRVYVESCLEKVSKPVIEKIAKNGGYLEPSNFMYYDKDKISYLCVQKDNDKCVNSLLLRKDMEEQISEVVRQNAEKCINLEVFKKQGFKIDEDELSVDARIGLDKIEIKADYPLTFSKKNSSMTIDKFSLKINRPLGRLYLLATHIINSQIRQGYFDQLNFMVQNGDSVIVQEHNPYPDTVFSLKKDDYIFNFALEGQDTVSDVGYKTENQDKEYGCCYIDYDNNCYKNVPRLKCERAGGLYDPNSACQCPSIEPVGGGCVDGVCNSCKISDGENIIFKKHGESWCDYDGIVGNGKDLVGSRHYMYYCVDGDVYVEECRDYREELCSQTFVKSGNETLTKAMCRVNRWESCNSCDSADCCQNEGYRDCYWNNQTKECVPEVPPGFRFWEGNGAGVCSIATSSSKCNGFGCGEDWLSGLASECMAMGDCGNYRNVNFDLTKTGFYHTNLQEEVDQKIYGDSSSLKKAEPLNLNPYANREIKLFKDSSKSGVNNLIGIISSAYSFMDQLEKMSLKDIKNKDFSDVSVKNIALCGIWKAPESGDCSACGLSPDKPCTEYMCKSLGKNCIFEKEKGVGYCHEISNKPQNPPNLEIDKGKTGKGYKLKEKTMPFNGVMLKGYNFTHSLQPYELLNISIVTDRESICEMRYMPKAGLLSGSGFYFSEGFSKKHSLNFPVPPQPEIPEKVLDLMNVTNATGFLDSMASVFSSEDDSQVKKIFSAVLGRDAFNESSDKNNFVKLFTSQLDAYKAAKGLIFPKIEKGGYYLFFYCENKAGVANKKPLFIELDISDSKKDEKAPVLKGTVPENNSKFSSETNLITPEFYFNEPAECKYSFHKKSYEEMNKSLNCTLSRYDISSKFQGSYLCRGAVPVANESVTLYLKCSDNPVEITQENFELIKTKNNVSRISVNENLLGDVLEFGSANFTLDYYLDDKQDCTIAYSPGIKENGSCGVADNLDYGQYKCRFDLKLNFTENSTKNISANILCSEDKKAVSNVNKKPFIYTLHRSKVLEILDFGPTGQVKEKNPLLSVKTSESRGVKCGFQSSSSLSMVMMENKTPNNFKSHPLNVSEGYNTYQVNCVDDFGNSAQKEIRFFVE